MSDIWDTLDQLGELWEQRPEQRLGQLIENYVNHDMDYDGLFYLTDDELIAKLRANIIQEDS